MATTAAAEAVKLSVDDSGFGLWEFSTNLGAEDHRELVAMGPLGENVGTVTRRQAVEEALASMQPRQDTALYETVLAAYREAKRNFDPDSVNNVVLLTDGRQDNPDGDLGLGRAVSQLRRMFDDERPVGLIAIAYGLSAPFMVSLGLALPTAFIAMLGGLAMLRVLQSSFVAAFGTRFTFGALITFVVIAALAARDGMLGKLSVERADGSDVLDTPFAKALVQAGFRPSSRGLRLRA